jgi:hypothetical protein
MREQEQTLRDLIAKLKDRLIAETAKSKEFGGKVKDALDQLQTECNSHDQTKVLTVMYSQSLAEWLRFLRSDIFSFSSHALQDPCCSKNRSIGARIRGSNI